MLSENEIQTKVNFLSSARCNHTFHKYIDITGDLIEEHFYQGFYIGLRRVKTIRAKLRYTRTANIGLQSKEKTGGKK